MPSKVPAAELGYKGWDLDKLKLGGEESSRRNDNMGVSKNRGTTKSSVLIGFSIINHPFWGTPIFGNTHIYLRVKIDGTAVKR